MVVITRMKKMKVSLIESTFVSLCQDDVCCLYAQIIGQNILFSLVEKRRPRALKSPCRVEVDDKMSLD